ncbi:hypothetical protein MSAS_14120 [Mycobacterium saskatchewanense]|uniref:Uncharacterized protein n=1 Tax=Mycobacterium saskatchewanense TaxID=220927 RepID=A0AAJ3TSS8_9MYCO|nr:hypothetical protein [Mycobacterium saskatchewanense]ORW64081.1 hypothetical protein AWC23_25840 [Mycobacterium saskatchewanense]BBX62238.1 hypothetical protein MSAS_14120 [Mycobacterium saskatchewanense]
MAGSDAYIFDAIDPGGLLVVGSIVTGYISIDQALDIGTPAAPQLRDNPRPGSILPAIDGGVKPSRIWPADGDDIDPNKLLAVRSVVTRGRRGRHQRLAMRRVVRIGHASARHDLVKAETGGL